ncbi:MAG TPA: hypothetical protein VF868_03635 [Bacteroidia bacterium]
MSQEKDVLSITHTASGTIYKRTDGILVFRQIPGRDSVTLDELKEQLNAFLEIQKGEQTPLMVVAEKLKRLESEEKIFLSSTVDQFASKVAIVTTTPIPTFIFNIFLFLTRPAIPGRIFDSEKLAMEWLKRS